MDGEVSDRSIASALLETYNVINTVLESDSVSSELPNMRKIKSAFELGQLSKKSGLCNQVFACARTEIDLPLPSLARTEQVDCSDLAQVCPGVSHLLYNPFWLHQELKKSLCLSVCLGHKLSFFIFLS